MTMQFSWRTPARAFRAIPLLQIPFLIIFVIGFLAPMAMLVWTSIRSGGGFNLDAYGEVLGSRVALAVLLRTLGMAAIVTVICVPLGYVFAYVLVTRAGRWATVLLATVAFPYLTSILVRTYAWIVILGHDGLINRLLLASGIVIQPLDLVFNSTGALIGMVHILLPLAVFPLYTAMQRVDPALISAARSLGGDSLSAFATVFLPLSMPGVAAASTLVFLSALGFYVTPALLGSASDYLLAQAIEVRVSLLAEFNTASAQAVILLLGVSALLIVLRRRIGVDGLRQQSGRRRRGLLVISSPACLHTARRLLGVVTSHMAGPVLWTGFAGLLLFLVVPLLIVIVIAFTSGRYLSFPPPGFSFRWFVALFEDPRWSSAAVFSLALSFASAASAVAVGSMLAFAIARPGRGGGGWLWLGAIAPMIVPHILIGLGLFFIVVPLKLTGSSLAFLIGFTVIGIPYAVVSVQAAISRFDLSLVRAAASLGASPLRAFLTVTLPLMKAAFASAYLFAFLAAFDDVVISLFLSAPGATTLSMRMWEDIRFDISPKTAAVAALQFLTLALLMLVAMVLRKQGRTAPGASRSSE